MRRDAPAAVSDGKRNGDIEMLRAIAILLVLADHVLAFWDVPAAQSALRNYASFWGGVDLFFAISGFVITQSLLRSIAGLESNEDRLRTLVSFWIKRVWRLWPAAWFWLIVPFVIALIVNPHMREADAVRANLSYVLGGILNVVNFQRWAFWHRNGMEAFLAGPYWSLSLEEQFYLVCAPLLLFVRRKWVMLILLAAIVIQFPMLRAANADNLSWFIRSDAFAWGVLLALLMSNATFRSLTEPTLLRCRWFAGPLLVLLVGSIAVMPQLMYSLPFGGGLIAALSGVLIFIASYDKGYLGARGFMRSVLGWIGERSYAIYLVHGAVIGLCLSAGPFSAMRRDAVPGLLVMTAAFLIATLILAEPTYRLIEVPARLHGRKLAKAYCDAHTHAERRRSTARDVEHYTKEL